MSNKIDSTILDKRILILEKFYHINLERRRENKIKSVCLTKQNDPKQNFTYNSSATNVKYEPRELMTKNI